MAIFLSARQSYVQAVIWGGALLVGACTLFALDRRFRIKDIPTEVKLLTLFWLWSWLGVVFAADIDLFSRYNRLVLQFILIVSLLSFVVARSGSTKPIYLAFIAVGTGLPLLQTASLDAGFSTETLRSLDRVVEANGLGFQSVLGVAGVLALFPETRNWFLRAALVLAGFFSLYGVVLSGSRGALVSLFLILSLWPLFCFRKLFRSPWMALACLALIAILGHVFYEYVMLETNLGRRTRELQAFEDHSSQFRLELFLDSFKIAMETFGVGAGLGQFGSASRTGYYAHSEFAELLGTSGLPGVVLYYLSYWASWRRLARVARQVIDRSTLYRINYAKMLLVVIISSGFLFRPNFLGQDTMIIYALVVGISLWAQRLVSVTESY